MARKTGRRGPRGGIAAAESGAEDRGRGQFYVFFGEEAFLKEHYWRMLEKKLLDGPAAEFNFHRFNAEAPRRRR